MTEQVKKRVALGMSGGVDSAVAAAVMLQAGYEVIGVTCRFAQPACEEDARAAEAAIADAAGVAARLGIAHMVWDARDIFRERVVDPFVAAYRAGLTPSPCVGCNADVKLPTLLAAAKSVGAEYIATGHYARITTIALSAQDERAAQSLQPMLSEQPAQSAQAEQPAQSAQAEQPARPVVRYCVKTALDNTKDQSYMLGRVPQELLQKLLLPLGGMTKVAVRLMAQDLGFAVADKPDSQDVCFAPRGYREVLAAFGAESLPGDVVRRDGTLVGRHTGLADYTVGQRKGIGIAAPQPYYVVEKDAAQNRLVVGFEDEARMVGVEVSDIVWQACGEAPSGEGVSVKLRYRTPAAPCVLERGGASGAREAGDAPRARDVDDAPDARGIDGTRGVALRVRLLRPQAPTAPGQYAVFYCGDMVLGAGIISEIYF